MTVKKILIAMGYEIDQNSVRKAKTSLQEVDKNARQTFDSVKKGVDGINDSIKKVDFSKLNQGFTVLKGMAANLLANVVSKVGSAISSAMGGAIDRVDTLESYGKVMQNLGYEAEQVDAAQNKLKDGIQGLPTTLPGIINMQQQFAALSGNIEEATDLTLALNNAGLAAGKGQGVADEAMQRWYKMISTGPDAQTWQSLYSTMPAQMNMLAEGMLGAGKKSDDLFQAWKNGSVVTEDIKNAFIRLNTEGVGALASFDTQARDSTGGIATSMTNVKTKIKTVVADVIQVIGSSNIAGVFDKIKKIIGDVGAVAVEITKNIKAFIEELAKNKVIEYFGNALKQVWKIIKDIVGIIGTIGGTILEALGFSKGNAIETLKKFATTLNNVLGKIRTFLGNLKQSEGFKSFLSGLKVVITYLMGIIVPILKSVITLIKSWVGTFKAIINTIVAFFAKFAEGGGLGRFINMLKAVFNNVKNAILGMQEFMAGIWNLFTAILNADFEGIVNAIKQIFSGLWKHATSILLSVVSAVITIVMGIIDTIVTLVKTGWNWLLNMFKSISDFFGGLPEKALRWGIDFIQGFINGIKNMVSGVVDAVLGIGEKIKNFLHFSRPDEGPLRDYETWMPDFMGGLADGIRRNKGRVLGEMQGLVAGINSMGMAASVSTANSVTGGRSTTYNINQNNSFSNSYSGEPGAAARNVMGAMRQSSADATTTLAQGLAFARG